MTIMVRNSALRDHGTVVQLDQAAGAAKKEPQGIPLDDRQLR